MKDLAKRCRNKISLPVAHRLIDHRESDIFLSAFPRSGSTWLRTMVSVVRYHKAEISPELYNENFPAVSIKNIHKIRRLQSARFIMTHSGFIDRIKKAVYVVRDGRDALVSYYHYSTTRRSQNLSFREFYRRYEVGTYGITWDQHVASWLVAGRKRLREDLIVVKFEDLARETEWELGRVCQFLNLKFDGEELRRAKELASIPNMRKVEAAEGRLVVDANASFYRSGQTLQWSDYFDDEIHGRFLAVAGATLRLAGYHAE